MHRLTGAIVQCVLSFSAWSVAGAGEAGAEAGRAWIERSNAYTNRLLTVEFEHAPERGSDQGLAQFDERISRPTLYRELKAGRVRGLKRGRSRLFTPAQLHAYVELLEAEQSDRDASQRAA